MILIEDLEKHYGNHAALKGINLEVKKGEILGLLGPNGAGKSTTMNIITGYIAPTSGCVKIDGIDIQEKPIEAKKKIGYLPEIPPLYADMTIEEYLMFVSKLKNVKKSLRAEQIEKILEKVKLKDVRGRLIKNLSKGYKQRVGIAQAIIGDPQVLILDEPTVGLDPKQIIEIRNLISDLGKEHTIILSSHILSEITTLCNRIVIINKGSIVAEGTYEDLSKQFSYGNKIALRVKGSFENINNALSNIENIESITKEEDREPDATDLIIIGKKDNDIREDIFNSLSNAKLPILMMKSLNLTLEEVFLEVTNQNKEVIVDDKYNK